MRRPPLAAAEPVRPVTAAEFAALLDALGPFEARPRLAVAVSGGPDSSALALLTHGWARAREGAVLALIVDHGLRPESTAEATAVARRLAAAGLTARILTWSGPKPSTGIQAAARDARYRLLESACRAEGIVHLLMAHQREDQAETVAMRAEAASGGVGLAGMAAIVEVVGLRRLRPLLGVPKARLIATLDAAAWAWVRDPSNLSPGFARGRLRGDPSFDPTPHLDLQAAQAAWRITHDQTWSAWLAAYARPHPLGWLRVDRPAWRELTAEGRRLALARLLVTTGGAVYPVARRALDRLAEAATDAVDGAQWTLGGCIVAVTARHLVVHREAGRVHERVSLAPGGCRLWDGRYLVRYAAGPAPLEVAALGMAGVAGLPPVVRRPLRSAGVRASALAALPALRDGGELVACPPLEAYGSFIRPGIEVTTTLRPVLALSGAAFAVGNVV